MKIQVSLYDDDAERFEELREAVAEERPGSKPDRPELLRVLMDEYQ